MNAQTAKILCELNNDFYAENYASFASTRQAPWPGWKRCLEVLRDAGGCRGVAPTPFAPHWENGAEDGLCVPSVSGTQEPSPVPVETQEPSPVPVGTQEPSPVPVPVPVPVPSLGNREDLSVFDLACGNLRFEAFLTAALPHANLSFYAVDNCNALLPQAALVSGVNYQSLDILGVLQEGRFLRDQFAAPACDLSVSFGFMHHVPLQEYREKILLSLIEQTRPGGYVIVSFWQFLKSETLRDKALVTHRRALKELGLQALGDKLELDTNDYLLGWQDIPGAYRYCHSFTQAEIDQLTASVAHEATKVASFVSDGKTNNLNTYIIIRVPQ